METTKNFKFSNGDKVTESVTGFKGVITGTSFYLTGCNMYLLTAKAKDEFSEPIGLWFDEGRLIIDQDNAIKEESVKAENNGCDKLPNIGKRGF